MKKVLIVEDQPCIRILVKAAIQASHPDAVFVDSFHGKHAWEVINRPGQHFDLVITDIKMPFMGGKELTDKIHAAYPRTRVIIISCGAEPADHKAHAFVRKPYRHESLMGTIRKVMEKQT